jgi:hypothetical protein
MRIVSAGLLALTATASFALAEDKYSSEPGRYTIVFPGKATESEQQLDTPLGKVTMHISTQEVKRDLAFISTYVDYPEAVKNEKPQIVLARVRDGTVGKGKLLSDLEMTLGERKVPGREYAIAKADGTLLRVRSYLDGARLYQIIVSGIKREDMDTPAAKKFVESFEVAK